MSVRNRIFAVLASAALAVVGVGVGVAATAPAASASNAWAIAPAASAAVVPVSAVDLGAGKIAITEPPFANPNVIAFCFGVKSFGWGKFEVCRDDNPFTHHWIREADTRTDGHCVWARYWQDGTSGHRDLPWNCGNGEWSTYRVGSLNQVYGMRTPVSSGVHGIVF